jgi:hypothetical protein
MVSTASHVGRTMHRHEIERQKLDEELAGDEASFRSKLAQKRQNDGKSRPLWQKDHVGAFTAAEVEAKKAAEQVQGLYHKHDARRAAQRDKQRGELEKARATAPATAKHEPQTQPLPHQPTFEVWRDLNDARKQAVRGVFASTALLRDKADAEVLDLSKTKGASRYMSAGTAVAADAKGKHEQRHLDISRSEHQELAGLDGTFRSEMAAERRKYEDQARERHEMASRHAAENRRTA